LTVLASTFGDLVKLALKDSGVLGQGQSASPEDVNDAWYRTNMMIAQWARKRWLIYHLVDVFFGSTGAQSYSVGPGGDFNVTYRPDRLEAAFFRQTVQSEPSQVDYPLELIEARETYNNIALKRLNSFPSYVFYDSAYPLGFIFPWPIPEANIYEIHLSLKEILNKFTTLSYDMSGLPAEYEAVIFYNLCARLRPAYQLPPDPTITAMAKDALNVLRGANTQIPRLNMPTDLIRPGIYNPYSDQIR
jgi:hypothetical protein